MRILLTYQWRYLTICFEFLLWYMYDHLKHNIIEAWKFQQLVWKVKVDLILTSPKMNPQREEKKVLFKDSCKKNNPLLENNDDMMRCKVCLYVFSFIFVISILPMTRKIRPMKNTLKWNFQYAEPFLPKLRSCYVSSRQRCGTETYCAEVLATAHACRLFVETSDGSPLC